VPPLLQGLIGVAGLLAIAWSLSEQRRQVPWRAVVAGLLLQFTLAMLLLKLPLAKDAFLALNAAMLRRCRTCLTRGCAPLRAISRAAS
jgi:CNT family concentrative nucleoside transporter